MKGKHEKTEEKEAVNETEQATSEQTDADSQTESADSTESKAESEPSDSADAGEASPNSKKKMLTSKTSFCAVPLISTTTESA